MKSIAKTILHPRVLLVVTILLMILISFISSSFMSIDRQKKTDNMMQRSSIRIQYADGQKFYVLSTDGTAIAFIKAD